MTITAHNSLCSTRAYHLRIDLARMPLLGNITWKIKKILCTRRIPWRCIATRGESVSTYPRRPYAEAFSNSVDVVKLLRAPTDQVPNVWHLRVLAHVQLDDDPWTPIQQNVGEEFRQHDGVVTILMFYCHRVLLSTATI